MTIGLSTWNRIPFIGIVNPSVEGYQDVRKFERHEKLSPLCKPNVILPLAELFSED